MSAERLTSSSEGVGIVELLSQVVSEDGRFWEDYLTRDSILCNLDSNTKWSERLMSR